MENPNQQPAPLSPSSNLLPNRNPVNKVLLITTIISLLLIISIAGYLFYTYKNLHADPIITLPQNTCTEELKLCPDGSNVARDPKLNCEFSPCPNSSDSTANWKTYINNEGHYSFRYPPNIIIQTRNEQYSFMTGKDTKVVVLKKSSIPSINSQATKEWFELIIYSEDNPSNSSPSELIQNYLQRLNNTSHDPRDTSVKTVTDKINKSMKEYQNGQINGIHALFGFDYDYDTIIQVKNNKIFTFQYTGENGGKVNPETERFISEILSTFKFTDQNTVSKMSKTSSENSNRNMVNLCSSVLKSSTNLNGIDFLGEYCSGKSCLSAQTKETCESQDIINIKVDDEKIFPGKDGKIDCYWEVNLPPKPFCRPNYYL